MLSITHHTHFPILAKVPSRDDVLLGGWRYRKPVKVSAGLVVSDITKLVAWFHVIDPDLRSIGYGGKVESILGTDIAFAQNLDVIPEGTEILPLRFDRRKYDPATGEFSAFVLLPLVTTADDTVFHLYYGNADTTDRQNKAATWNDEWQFALLGDTVDAYGRPLLADATANRRHGVPSPALDIIAALVPGPLPGVEAVSLDNSGPVENLRMISPPVRGQTSISFWYQHGGFGSPTRVYDHVRSQDNQGILLSFNGSTFSASVRNPAALANVLSYANAGLTNGLWHQITVVWDGINEKCYVDGSLVGSANYPNQAEPGYFAYWGGSSGFYSGNLAGMRGCARALSATYLAAEQLSYTNGLFTVQVEEALPVVTVTEQQIVCKPYHFGQLPTGCVVVDNNAYLFAKTEYIAKVTDGSLLPICWQVDDVYSKIADGQCWQDSGFDANSKWFPLSPNIPKYQDQSTIVADRNLSGFMTVRVWAPLSSLPEDVPPLNPASLYYLEDLSDNYVAVNGFSHNIVYNGVDEQFQTWIFRGPATLEGVLSPFPASHP